VGIVITNDEPRHRWEIFEDGELAGVLAYRDLGDAVDLVHTEIDPARGGRGLAAVLVAHVLDDARDKGRMVVPSCPYVHRFIDERRDAYLDLVADTARSSFDQVPDA